MAPEVSPTEYKYALNNEAFCTYNSTEKCTSCDYGYILRSETMQITDSLRSITKSINQKVCRPNNCYCDNGIPITTNSSLATVCYQENGHYCSSCNDYFHEVSTTTIDEETEVINCSENICYCQNGTEKIGDCIVHGCRCYQACL